MLLLIGTSRVRLQQKFLRGSTDRAKFATILNSLYRDASGYNEANAYKGSGAHNVYPVTSDSLAHLQERVQLQQRARKEFENQSRFDELVADAIRYYDENEGSRKLALLIDGDQASQAWMGGLKRYNISVHE